VWRIVWSEQGQEASMTATTRWLGCLVIGLLLGCQAEEPPDKRQDLRVMSFNVLCSFCVKDDHEPWADRVPYLQGLIKQHDADLIGLQEQFWAAEDNNEVLDMIATHPVYTPLYYISVPPKKPPAYPDATIYYRTERFEEIDHGFYWLSKEPDKPYSGGWASAQLPRLVAWVNLRDRWTERELYFANTHYDPNSPNQKHSAPLMLERTSKDAKGRPAIVVGDFNAEPDSEAYGILVGDKGDSEYSFVDTRNIAKIKRIVHNAEVEPVYPASERIDHVFVVDDKAEVSDWLVDMQRFGAEDLFPSDHRLIMSTLKL